MTPVRLAIRHVTSRPLRSALTVVAIGLSAGLVGFLYLVNGALKNDWSENMGRRAMVMAKSSFFERIPMAYLAKLEDVPGVQRVCPFDFLMAFWKNDRPENQVPFQAAPADAFLEVYMEAKIPADAGRRLEGRPDGLDHRPDPREAARLEGRRPHRPQGARARRRHRDDDPRDHDVQARQRPLRPPEVFREPDGRRGRVGMYWILAKSRPDVARVTAEIERRLDNAPVPIRAMSEKQWQLMFMEMLGNVQALLGGIGLATAFTLFLITSNTLAMSARERRGETALLRVLGFPRKTVLRLLVLEGAFFGVAGAILAVGFMNLFALLVGKALIETQWAGIGALLTADATMITVVAGLSLLVAIASSLIPAFNLSRRPIVSLAREAA